MALDSHFVIASDLQSLLRDKDTGLPLRNGVIYFWKDAARSEPKDVYKLSGSPPDYSYVNIGSQINLTAAGTISDNENPANDIILYYFPYEGTPDNPGDVELYYVQVYSEGGTTSGVLQFTRQAWPNIVAADTTQTDFTNYIPNGQFKIHNDIPADSNHVPPYVAGEIRQAITNLSQGGWTFNRPNASTAKDIVTFESFGDYVSNPTASPRYAARIENQTPNAGDSFKDLRVKFDDVNKFASTTQTYTLAFSGQSHSGNVNVSLVLIKNYGTGGDPEEETTIANFTITTSYAILQKSGFVFGVNTGKAIGTLNDDYVQLAIRFPTGSLFDVSLTDFVLTPGTVTVTDFPQTTDGKFREEAIAGWMSTPAYDGSDLYLPLKLTSTGLIFDDSEIGDLVSETQLSVYVNSLHPTTNRMLADGAQYPTDGYSPLGIPYKRLWNKYWEPTKGYPRYGTGKNYVTMLVTDLSPRTQDILFTNKPGSVTSTADGTPATGFSFAELYTGNDTYNVQSLFSGNGTFYIWDNLFGTTFGTTGAGTSGFTVTQSVNNAAQRAVTFVSAIAPTGLAGKYFQFGNTTTQYYVWFTVDGGGSDPAPGGTGIEVKLFSSMTMNNVGMAIAGAIAGFQATLINFTSGATVPAGSYFSFNTIDDPYYVWYQVNGAGTDPAPPGKIAIGPVQITSSSTAEEVSLLTQRMINSKFFAVPDARGMFPRFWDNDAGIDPNTNIRWTTNPYNYGDIIGTNQFGEIQQHTHTYTDPAAVSPDPGHIAQGDSYGPGDVPTSATGGNETRPINFSLNAAILY